MRLQAARLPKFKRRSAERSYTIEARALGIETAEEEGKRTVLHLAVKHYLESVEALKKPNTLRKYRAVLNRFVEFLPVNADPRKIIKDHLTDFMVGLKNLHKLDNNTVIHQMVIVAQFLKRHGKAGVTKNLGLPERVTSLPREYGDPDLIAFFKLATLRNGFSIQPLFTLASESRRWFIFFGRISTSRSTRFG